MSDTGTPDLHALAQHLATASLAVDAASAFLERGDLARLHRCLDAAATALAEMAGWIEAKRAEDDTPEATRP
ncbi:MAG TPA: hypothetical protein VGN96_02985 [Roseococcus sp.]|jgi:hypothetical protein|nr:hypothetical protein [Roseococcus sp.]